MNVFLTPLSSVETSIFAFQNQAPTNPELNELVLDVHDYRLGIWKNFNEDHFVFTKLFFPYQTVRGRTITRDKAKKQLIQFLDINPMFRARTLDKVLTKLMCWYCTPERRDQLASMCQFLSYDTAVPMTDDEEYRPQLPSAARKGQLKHDQRALDYASDD